MRSIQRVFTVLTVVFFILHLPVSQELEGKNGYYNSHIDKVFEVESGGLLDIKDISGDVTVTSWERNQVEVKVTIKINVFTENEAKEILKRFKDNFEKEGNTVRIRGMSERNWIQSRYSITVPRKFNLDIQTRGGDISIGMITGDVTCSTSGGDIDLRTVSGKVKVNTSGGDLNFSEITGAIDANTSGGDVNLKNISDGDCNINTSGGSISLDHAESNVTLKTSGGDITVRSIKGELGLYTSGGDIDVIECSGSRATMKTSGGDISLIDLKCKVEAHTSGGDISGNGFDLPLSVYTSGGDIELSDLNTGITGKTSGGDINVKITLEDFSKPHGVELETSGGDITLIIPEKMPASITAEIYLYDGYGSWERYDIYSEFPLTKTVPDETRKRMIRCTGDINGGGDKIYLKTSSGDIHIQKSQEHK
jgi:DUF4097 and DUF4098 domain-containing protein YvlB